MLEVIDEPGREYIAARRGHPHPARAAGQRRHHQRPALRPRAHDRPHAAALAAARRPASRPGPLGRGPVPAGGRGHRARRRLLRPLLRRRRRLDGADRRRPGQGPGRRRGHRARPPHDARRRGLRVAAERRPDAPAPRAQGADRRRGPLLHRLLRHACASPTMRSRSSSPAAGTRSRSSSTPTAASRRSGASARCWAPTSSRC